MNRNGLKIGEFSRLCRVTVRALRHYEKIKLLVPEIIDYSTGYRYYSVAQMQKALNIVRLKGLGFSLEEIRTMYDSETQRPSIDMLFIGMLGRQLGDSGAKVIKKVRVPVASSWNSI